VLARVHGVASALWAGLASGAALGFLARDAAGLRQPLVGIAWAVGALLPALPLARGRLARRRRRDSERGQATVEFTALVLAAGLVLGALAGVAPRFDGHSFGGFVAFRMLCAVGDDCGRSDRALARAYGARDAALVRDNAPNLVYEPGERQLPVDWHRCRRPACARAPDERGLDAHRTDAGERATVFTHVIRRRGRTYLQYWLYYPDSNTTWAGSDRAWEAAWLVPRMLDIVEGEPDYPGFHRDDWESYVVRLDPDGRAWVRASSHEGWQGCKEARCRNEWTARTGWTRVSRGSHAGHIPLRLELRGGAPRIPRYVPQPADPHTRVRRIPLIPGRDLDERTTTSEGLRLIPLETRDTEGYRRRDDDVLPPWEKEVYTEPESDKS
jgi:hypothetical protein